VVLFLFILAIFVFFCAATWSSKKLMKMQRLRYRCL